MLEKLKLKEPQNFKFEKRMTTRNNLTRVRLNGDSDFGSQSVYRM